MKLNYKNIKEIKNPSLYLCNPNQVELYEIIPESASVTLRLNDISELNITVNKYVSGYNSSSKQVQPCYELLESKRLIKVECVGWFEIKSVTENDGDGGSVKTITAQSHQCTLRDKGFYVYDSVYKFYNHQDPYDSLFDASDISSVPSVCGQLYKQLGIKFDLSDVETFPTNDYGEWTIIYIDEQLRFNEDNIYRTLQSETTNGYDFMINAVEKAFEVLWLFDLLTHSIKVKYISSITQPTNIYLSYDNLIQNIETTENAESIVTVLNCNGGNGLKINSVNPMGTNYIVNFDYYKNTKWMSPQLMAVLDQWKTNYENKVDEFSELVIKLQNAYESLVTINDDIQYEELKIKSLSDGRDVCIQKAPLKLETVMHGEYSKCTQSPYYTKSLPDSIKANYYKEPFNYSDGIFSPVGDFVNDWGDVVIRNGYCYFSDGDSHSYCKFINLGTSTSLNCGFERYGICPSSTATDYDISENSSMMLAVETITDGKKSISENSNFYNNPFSSGNLSDGSIFRGTKKPPKPDDMYAEGEYLDATLDVLAQNEFNYFRDCVGVSSDGQYCKINMSAKIDTTTHQEVYYVSGFTRYALLSKANEWITKHEKRLAELEAEKSQHNDNINNITQQMDAISRICNIQSYVKSQDNDNTLYKELQSYWCEGDYSNDSYSLTDSMTMVDGINLSKQLKEVGEKQIKRVSQPKFSFNISSLDFLKLKDFQTFAEQLELGKTIVVERADGVIYEPAITELTFNLFNGEDFSMTFSNSARLNGNEFTFADLVAESSSVTTSVSSNWQDLLSYSKSKKDIYSLIANPLDRVLRAGLGGATNQEFVVDNTGILGRKYTDDGYTSFGDEQIRLINNLILFTDDNWNSAKTALGKIFYTDEGVEKSAYGLIAQTIIGDLIMSNALKIKNSEKDSESTILLNKDGISIKNDSGMTLFCADISGNVSITGQINATSGYIGTKDSGFAIDSNSLSHSLDNENKRVLISTGTLENYQVHNSENINQWMLIVGKDFGVTNDGKLFASTGNIAGLELGKQITKDDENITYSGLYCKNFALEIGSDSSGNKFTEIVFRENDNLSSQVITSLSKDRIVTNYGAISTLESNIINSNTITSGGIKVGGKLSVTKTGLTCQLSVADEAAGIKDDYGVLFFEGDKTTYEYIANLIKDGNNFYIIVDSALHSSKTFSVLYQNIFGQETSTTLTIAAGSTSSEHKNSGGVLYQVCFANTNYSTTLRFQQGSSGSSSTTSYRNLKTNANFVPRAYTPNYTIKGYNLGASDLRWACLYAYTINTEVAGTTGSDIRLKNTIEPINDKYDLLFDKLRPVTYFLNKDNSKKHLGLIANELYDAMSNNELNPYTDGIYSEFEQDNEYYGSICYEELIPLNIHEIQKLKKRVAVLEEKLQKYELQEG